jgi:uncharacterized protein (TIGR03086 family)
MRLLDAHGAAMHDFDQLTSRIGDGADRWDRPTACTGWSVRDLLGHLVTEQLWVPALLAGQTVAEVGDRFAGDPLGEDPVAAWRTGSGAARRAWLEPGATERTVHLSYGVDSATNYGWQMTLDLAVHGWDLATGLGVDYRIPAGLATRLYDEFAEQVARWQGTGLFDAPLPVAPDADPHTRLLALLGRQA